MATVESKEAAQYTDNGSAAEHCGICEYFSAGGTRETGQCRIVSGPIKFGGWCRHYWHVHEAA